MCLNGCFALGLAALKNIIPKDLIFLKMEECIKSVFEQLDGSA